MRQLTPILVLIALPLAAEEQPAPPVDPDPAMVALVEELGYSYETEDNGDLRLLFEFDEDERSQQVWIRNRAYEYEGVAMRDVWATALKLPGKYASVKLADELLRGSYEGIMGGWARERDYIVYIVKLPVDAGARELDAAITETIRMADRLEQERTQADDF